MKIGKFVGKETITLNNNDIAICIDRLQGSKLNFTSDSDILGRIYNRDIEGKIKGVHNYWGTQYRDRHFTANLKRIGLYITKKEGKIETDNILEYVEGSEGTVQYSASLKVYGDLHYKYQRGSDMAEVYSFYDYDTDLGELLKRVREYYNNLNL